jgi:uncharacterized protein
MLFFNRCPSCNNKDVRLSRKQDKGSMRSWFSADFRCRNCRTKFQVTRFRGYFSVALAIAALAYGAFELRKFVMNEGPRNLTARGSISADGEALEVLKNKARLGDVESQFRLAFSLRQSGRSEDDKQAVEWFRRAQARGHQDSAFYLGMHYSEGRGVLQDYPEAMLFIGKLADTGHANAQNMVGNFYRRGLGMPINKTMAYVWYNIAASKGHRDAQQFRDIMGSQLSGPELAEAQKNARQLDMQLQRGEGSGKFGLTGFAGEAAARLPETDTKPVLESKAIKPAEDSSTFK